MRSIYFEYNNEEDIISLGTLTLCLYYATQLNAIKAKKLLDSTLSEWSYRINYDLPLAGLTSDNDDAHFITSEVQEVVTFLENDLIPALNNESEDLLHQYDGKLSFINLYYNDETFLKAFGIDENDFFYSDGETLAHYMNRLKIVLQYCLTVNQPCRVYVS